MFRQCDTAVYVEPSPSLALLVFNVLTNQPGLSKATEYIKHKHKQIPKHTDKFTLTRIERIRNALFFISPATVSKFFSLLFSNNREKQQSNLHYLFFFLFCILLVLWAVSIL